jgi:hypothetical protein
MLNVKKKKQNYLYIYVTQNSKLSFLKFTTKAFLKMQVF